MRKFFALFAIVVLAAVPMVPAAVTITNVKAQPISPWGAIGIDFDVGGSLPGHPEEYSLYVVLTNQSSKTAYSGVVRPGQGGLSLGHHSVVCDMTETVASLAWASKYAVTIGYDTPLYCVVDLSAGPSGGAYPVYYLFNEPVGGWSAEYKTTKLVLRRIAAGSFAMQGVTTTKLSRPFYIGVFEVTQAQWGLVMGDGTSVSSQYPVAACSYDMIRGPTDGSKWPNSVNVDGTSFLGRLQARTGLRFDLPTEAQWEYACRAGTATTYYWGSSLSSSYARYGSSSGGALYVGSKLPNKWGLYDMSGNVWEWCLDWYGKLAYGTDPKGATSGDERVMRGGSYSSTSSSSDCSSSARNSAEASMKYSNVGFRVSWTIP